MNRAGPGAALRSTLVLAGLTLAGWLSGRLGAWTVGLGAVVVFSFGGWSFVRWWRSPERWPGRVVRRGAGSDAAHWLVDVPPPAAAAAESLAARLAGRGASATFFLTPGASALARRLRLAGHCVGWLGVPEAGDAELAERLALWRPARGVAGAGEHRRAAALGLRAVAPTLALPVAPSGLQPVATDLVLVPAALPPAVLDVWLEDHERRAIRLCGLRAE